MYGYQRERVRVLLGKHCSHTSINQVTHPKITPYPQQQFRCLATFLALAQAHNIRSSTCSSRWFSFSSSW